MNALTLLKHALPILVRPTFEWSIISAKTITPPELYLGYVVPLSAIEPVARTIQIIEFAYNDPGRWEWADSYYWTAIFPSLLTSYVWQLIAIYLLAHFVTWLTPRFSYETHYPHVLKLLAFSLTPIWCGKLFFAIPFFSLDRSIPILAIAYSGYLLYLGVLHLMNSSPPKALVYTGAIALAVWAAWKAPSIAIAVDRYWRQHVLDQDTKTMIVVFAALSGVVLILLYQRYAKEARKAFFYTAIVAVALLGAAKATSISAALQALFEGPFDESTKTIIAVLLILSVVALIVLYDKYCKTSTNTPED